MSLTTAATLSDRDTGKGMALMTFAVLVFPGLDALAKVLGATLSPFQIGFLRYAMQTLILVAAQLALARVILPPAARAALPRLILVGALMGCAAGTLFWSFQHLPLANAIALFFVAPLILTVFGALFLRERVGWHRTTAVLVGLLGAVVVVRPNWAAYGVAAVLPLVAALAFAATMATIRSLSGRVESLTIQTVAGGSAALFLGAAVLAGTAAGAPLLAFVPPTGTEWMLLLALAGIATVAQSSMTLAFRFADASLLAPFYYLEIVGATAFGYLLFGEFPDTLTAVGTAIILGAGLAVVHRERRLARARRIASPEAPP